jgi:hypothetical protein
MSDLPLLPIDTRTTNFLPGLNLKALPILPIFDPLAVQVRRMPTPGPTISE